MVLIVSAPLVITIFLTLWRTPFPVSEAVALFEDVSNQPPVRFLVPDTSYYRPLYHLTLSAIWHSAGSLSTKLALVKALQMVPAAVLVLLLIWHLRPRTSLAAAAAVIAVAVLVGSPGFRDNIELPLSYTTVGMPLLLAVWMLLQRPASYWCAPVVVVLTLLAIGFKEQGLVIVPVVMVAWWTGAPSADRRVLVSVVAVAMAYVALRVSSHGRWATFEQSVGVGFVEYEPADAVARFGEHPYWIYAYNGLSTIANVLFAEPTRGVFRITRDVTRGHPDIWQLIQIGSSAAMTSIIGWWGVRALRDASRHGWNADARLCLALIAALLGCGVLSFNYSRDRLGGMALVLYAVASAVALETAARQLLQTRTRRFAIGTAALAVTAMMWQTRAIGTIESERVTSLRNQLEWLTALPSRRVEFADRPTYLHIMEDMFEQGTAPGLPRPTRYPTWVLRTLGVQ